MPLEIRELVIKMTIEEPTRKSSTSIADTQHLEERIQQMDDKIAQLTEIIENIYDR